MSVNATDNYAPEAGIQPLLLSIKQTADALGVSEKQITNLVKSGELPSKMIGARRMFSVEMLRAYANGESVERWKKSTSRVG